MLLQNPLTVIIEFLKDKRLAFFLEVIFILVASIPLIVVSRQIRKKISSKRFIVVAISLLFTSLISVVLYFFTALTAYFSFGGFSMIMDLNHHLSLYRGVYVEPWIRYKDVQAGISYSYPSKGFDWKIVNNSIPAGQSWLFSDPANTILYVDWPYWSLAFVKNPTKKFLEVMIKDEEVKKAVVINNEIYSVYRDTSLLDADNLDYANILVAKDQSLLIKIFAPVGAYPDKAVYNKLFLKIIESIRKN